MTTKINSDIIEGYCPYVDDYHCITYTYKTFPLLGCKNEIRGSYSFNCKFANKCNFRNDCPLKKQVKD
ncbi:hypothetical protein RZ882_016385 [Clostridioides difficile]|uniref:hypothetical protein n=1 Tax=Clostridioides difficile TaxID=1496 RepID=UPI0008A60976|nr:hypothetical protein [Clostridioides difficile]OFU26629.1 hypothetical protein HMPREF3075_17295 [Clostridium sp. HMSC19B11]EGT3847795.1 hypothetical protein [Clostridioides difficile]EGT4699214.1 hypothetical protein [Clostridioides difficile]EGT4916837.1 hypothetical protein [Clostridioides difficile]EII6780883.1 hypothetical protein [Clostridioides difficile]